MNDWHQLLPILNSLVITLMLYVLTSRNLHLRERLHRLESARKEEAPPAPPPPAPVPQGGPTDGAA